MCSRGDECRNKRHQAAPKNTPRWSRPTHVVKQDGSQTPAKRAPHSAVASGQLSVVIDGSLGQAGLWTQHNQGPSDDRPYDEPARPRRKVRQDHRITSVAVRARPPVDTEPSKTGPGRFPSMSIVLVTALQPSPMLIVPRSMFHGTSATHRTP